jgi:hypothetical protein
MRGSLLLRRNEQSAGEARHVLKSSFSDESSDMMRT